ncbi:MAG: hypothetical protein KIT84_27855 [Labilithrix sp.]|nr:hypothetical protein [Labilithrix sp.]MCW5814875.1 hypothetical protein [Labilithrix sp.]
MRLRLFALSLACLSAGCGGGSPLLHPARTLSTGDVRAAGGLSANIVPGSLANDLAQARAIAAADPSTPGAPGSNPDYAKGALVAAAIAPGLAPYAGARVGIGARYEAGLAYTGRAVRVDVRRAFGDGPWTFSAGAGGSAALYGRQQGTELPNVAIGAMRGYGFDVPLLAGWESAGGIYKAWFGARGGFERIAIEELTSEPKSVTIGTPPIDLRASRFYGGGVVGIATGFHHVHVALEASVAYQVVNGSYNATSATVHGITIAPATALWWSF